MHNIYRDYHNFRILSDRHLATACMQARLHVYKSSSIQLKFLFQIIIHIQHSIAAQYSFLKDEWTRSERRSDTIGERNQVGLAHHTSDGVNNTDNPNIRGLSSFIIEPGACTRRFEVEVTRLQLMV